MFGHCWPYTDFHELNLDWLLATVAELEKEIGKVGDIDEKIKELEDLINQLDLLLSESLGKGIVDKSLYNLFAQVRPDLNNRFNANMYAEGFCIGSENNRPVCMQCFIDLTNAEPNNTNTVVFTYMDDGSELARFSGLSLGHANSCCYNATKDKYYIATGGGNAALYHVQEIASDGTLGAQHTIDNRQCWAITWNKDIFYALCYDPGEDKSYFYKLDNDFNILDSYDYEMYTDRTFVYQGMCADDNFLYIYNGNTITGDNTLDNINRVTVCNHNGKPLKQVLCAYPLEIEEGDFYNGMMYAASNTTHESLIIKMDMYTYNRKCTFGEPLDNIDLNRNIITIHVNEGETNFFMDGATTGALSAITYLILWLRNCTDRMNIVIDSDITQVTSLSFRRCPNTIFDINGQGHVLPNLLFESGEVYINNALFPGVDNANTIDFYGNRIVINNCKFGYDPDLTDPNNPIYDTTLPARIISLTSSYEIDGITINQNTSTTGVLFYFLGTGYLRTVNIVYPRYNYYALLGTCIADSSFPLNNLRNQYRQTYKPGFSLTSTATVDFTKLKFPCRFLRAGATITNLPAGETSSNIFLIDVELSGTVNTVVTIHHNDHTETTYFN